MIVKDRELLLNYLRVFYIRPKYKHVDGEYEVLVTSQEGKLVKTKHLKTHSSN